MVIDVGQVIDKYELLERVGQGGMAIVYRGLDRSLQRQVAVKVLHKHLAEHQEARDRFEREAQAVAKLRHENILEIFDYSGRSSDESYIVTEFIEGWTLKQFCNDHPPQYPEIGAMIVTQICRALAHAHAQGVLHRDVKPENVMIRSDGVVKLMDFGISQMIDTQRLTVTGQLLGSPAYMSPEHVEGKPLDVRTDVFAGGIVLYQLTTGKLPFEGRNPHEILKRIAECKFPDPRHVSPRIGNELGRIILRAMARDPEQRFRDMGEMLGALERYLDGSGLGGVKEELARFFKSPASYEMALKARLVDHLLRRAKDCLAGGNQPVALELLDRVLAIDPSNPQVTEILSRLGKRRRTRSYALAVVAVLAVGGGAWALRHALAGGIVPVGGAVPDATQVAIAEPVDAAVALPAVDAAVIVDAAARASDGRAAAPASGNDNAPVKRRIDAGVPRGLDAGVGGTFVVRLTVSPKDSQVRVDGGTWQTLPAGSGELAIPAAGAVVSVRNDACCEAVERTIRPDDAGKAIAVNLGLLAAKLTPRCGKPGVKVQVDKRPVNLDKDVHIPFGETTQTTKKVLVEFISEEEIDAHEVVVKYATEQEVKCDFQ